MSCIFNAEFRNFTFSPKVWASQWLLSGVGETRHNSAGSTCMPSTTLANVRCSRTHSWEVTPRWCFHLNFPIRHNQLLVVTPAWGSPGNDGPSPLIEMKYLEPMGRLPTSPLPHLGIVWAQIGDNTWVKGGLFFHNALPLFQEEENPFRCQQHGLSLNSGPSLISHTEVWQNSFVTFMTYWEINLTPSLPSFFTEICRLYCQQQWMWMDMCWLFPTTCLFTTTQSTDGEPGGWTRRKVGLCFPEGLSLADKWHSSQIFPSLNLKLMSLSRSGECPQDCVDFKMKL